MIAPFRGYLQQKSEQRGILRKAPEDSCSAIPYSAFREIFNLPRGDPVRVAVLLLAITGCRPSEPDAMNPNNITPDGWLYWQPGKGQRGTRKEYLPKWFREELSLYRATHRVPTDRILGYQALQVRRYFNRYVRPHLSDKWRIIPTNPMHPHRWQEGHVLQLKGLRKSFATAVFSGYLRKGYDSIGAMEATCARMRHSNRGITVTHYLKEMDRCEINLWQDFYDGYAKEAASQVCLLDYS